MKTTRELYMQDATMWAKLPYKEAIQLRIIFAKQAMDYYRVRHNEEGYMASEKAVAFNRALLNELL
jgi:hypothetical protein